MYPAGTSASDWPETVFVPDIAEKPSYDPLGDGGAGDSSGQYTKSVSEFLRDDGNWKILVVSGGWQFQAYYEDEWRAVLVENFNCLIFGDGNLISGTDIVEDQFSGTYEVTFSIYTLTITRQSACIWETDGFNESCTGFVFPDSVGVRVQYFAGEWLMTVADFGDGVDCVLGDAAKTGNQDTPVGDYDFGDIIYTVA
jgi:hypothetical protein